MATDVSEQRLPGAEHLIDNPNELANLMVTDQLAILSGNVILVDVHNDNNSSVGNFDQLPPSASISAAHGSLSNNQLKQELLDNQILVQDNNSDLNLAGGTSYQPVAEDDGLNSITMKPLKRFKCSVEDCPWSFDTTYKLRRHEETHSGRKVFQCTVNGCGRMFTTCYNLKSHMRQHERAANELCAVCGAAFQTRTQRDKHVKTHNIRLAMYSCVQDGCDRVFDSIASLSSHRKSHLRVSEYVCEFSGCGRVYDKLCRLKQHQRYHTKEKPYVCSYEGCDWSFATSSQLLRHSLRHTGLRRWVCPYDECQRSFSRSEHLRDHMTIHSGQKPYACHVEGCGASFKCKWNLTLHSRRHDKTSGLSTACDSSESTDRTPHLVESVVLTNNRTSHSLECLSSDENDHFSDSISSLCATSSVSQSTVGGVSDVVALSYSVHPVPCSLSVQNVDCAATYLHAQLLQDDPPGPELYSIDLSSCVDGLPNDQSSFTSANQLIFVTGDQLAASSTDQSAFITADQSAFSSASQSVFTTADQLVFTATDQSAAFITADQSALAAADQLAFVTTDQSAFNTHETFVDQSSSSSFITADPSTFLSLEHTTFSPGFNGILQGSDTSQGIPCTESTQFVDVNGFIEDSNDILFDFCNKR